VTTTGCFQARLRAAARTATERMLVDARFGPGGGPRRPLADASRALGLPVAEAERIECHLLSRALGEVRR
jgi:hypothetical protein